MNLKLQSLLPIFFPGAHFSVTSVAGVEIGMVHCTSDAFLKAPLPRHTPNIGIFPAKSRMAGPLFDGREYDTPKGVERLAFSPARQGEPSLIIVGADGEAKKSLNPLQAHAYFGLLVATQEGMDSIGIITPFEGHIAEGEQEEEIAGKIISGAMSMLSDSAPSGLHSVIIQCPSAKIADMMAAMIASNSENSGAASIETTHALIETIYSKRLESYLEGRTKEETKAPELIFGHDILYATPMIPASDEKKYAISDATKPPAGFVRFVPNWLMDRAISDVPDFIRNVDIEVVPPPYLYSRCHIKPQENGGQFSLFRNTAFEVSTVEAQKFISSEISLTDVPLCAFTSLENFFGMLLSHYTPNFLLRASALRFPEGSIPKKLFTRLERNMADFEYPTFDEADFDRILAMQLRHEFAEIFWYTISRDLKIEWVKLYHPSLEKTDNIHFYRNLVRVYTELTSDEHAVDFFARETFADRMAMFWSSEIPEILTGKGTAITEEERKFFDTVMAEAYQKKSRLGSAFVMNP